MQALNLFNSFRVRLLLVLALLLVATLSVQFFLNRRAEQRVARRIAEQEQSLAAGISLALQSFSVQARLKDLDQGGKFLQSERQARRVTNVLSVRDEGSVPGQLDGDDIIDDSLDPAYNPERLDDGTDRYVKLSQVPLPRLVSPEQPTSDRPVAGQSRAFVISAQTSKGRFYIIVALGTGQMAGNGSPWRALRPLLPTLSVLLVATLVTIFLVWRFTQPIRDLSHAAQRVAAGDFDFRVPAAERSDEMGALARVFNEMIARLGRMRELEGQLHQAERSAVVGRLASAIAHEVRNPLNYINLTLDHLRSALAPKEPDKRAIVDRLTDQLKVEVQRINVRISEFLSYSRPARLELRPLDLRAIVNDALRLVEAQAAERNIETRVEQASDLAAVHGDPESLRSLFTNLIINGVQAMEGNGAGGRLTVALANEAPGRVRVEITDTGRGIAADDISQVFEPYFSTKDTGTGLGLAIAKKAVDDHGGTITVRSKQGAGTTFTITLPTEERSEVRG
ncbi:MAG TPA: ATP-binding protein [Pyrinomonadaceae bacterium]|jgi:signal transduction histidine kinase